MREFRGVLRWATKRAQAETNARQNEERAAARARILGVAAALDVPLHAQPTTPPGR